MSSKYVFMQYVQFVMSTKCTEHVSVGALIDQQKTIHWIFTKQNWAAYWALMKQETLPTGNSGET